MNKFFNIRKNCPGCNSAENKILYSYDYQEKQMEEYLQAFYGEQGEIEFEFLKDAFFILTECKNCEMIFQREIPNDFLMEKLYEKWINPEKAYKIYESNYPVDYYYSNAFLVF